MIRAMSCRDINKSLKFYMKIYEKSCNKILLKTYAVELVMKKKKKKNGEI